MGGGSSSNIESSSPTSSVESSKTSSSSSSGGGTGSSSSSSSSSKEEGSSSQTSSAAAVTFGTAENPWTVAQLVEYGKQIGKGNYSPQQTYVKGYVVGSVTKSNQNANTYQFEIADTKGDSTKAKVWWALYESGEPYTNDVVIINGYVQNYNDTIELSTSKNGQASENSIASITRGESSITTKAGEGTTIIIDESKTSGTNLSTFTFSVSVSEGYKLSYVKVNGEEVTESEGKYTGTIKGDTTVESFAISTSADTSSVAIDYKTNFETYAKDWSNSYVEHKVSGSDLGITNASVTTIFSRASKQSQTITDMPVAAPSSGPKSKTDKTPVAPTVYVTISVADKNISGVTFTLTQWSKKTFNSMYIEYTTDNSQWTMVEGVGFKDASTAKFENTLTASSIQNAVAIRLVLGTTSTSNVQVGIESANLTLVDAPAA